MSQHLTASINLDKIDEKKIITGKKGRYVNIGIWINDTPNQFGKDVSIQQLTEANEPKIYLGEGKISKPK
jgi:hypothetical protein